MKIPELCHDRATAVQGRHSREPKLALIIGDFSPWFVGAAPQRYGHTGHDQRLGVGTSNRDGSSNHRRYVLRLGRP